VKVFALQLERMAIIAPKQYHEPFSGKVPIPRDRSLIGSLQYMKNNKDTPFPGPPFPLHSSRGEILCPAPHLDFTFIVRRVRIIPSLLVSVPGFR